MSPRKYYYISDQIIIPNIVLYTTQPRVFDRNTDERHFLQRVVGTNKHELHGIYVRAKGHGKYAQILKPQLEQQKLGGTRRGDCQTATDGPCLRYGEVGTDYRTSDVVGSFYINAFSLDSRNAKNPSSVLALPTATPIPPIEILVGDMEIWIVFS